MYEKELQRILTASQNNALTFFVGAGVSALSGAPTWKGLIHAISDRLGQARKDEYSSDEYLQIPQMFYYSLGENKEEYYTFVKAQLHSSPMLPNVIHREMLNLNPVSFITTNYDTLLEDAAVQYCQSFKVVSRDEDVPTIFGDRFSIISDNHCNCCGTCQCICNRLCKVNGNDRIRQYKRQQKNQWY